MKLYKKCEAFAGQTGKKSTTTLLKELNKHFNRGGVIKVLPRSFIQVVEKSVSEYSSAIRRKEEKTWKFKKELYEIVKGMNEEAPAYLMATDWKEKLGII